MPPAARPRQSAVDQRQEDIGALPGADGGETGDLLCVVGPRPLDRTIVSAAGVPYKRLNVGGIHGMALWQAIPNLLRFVLAVPRAVAILRAFRPSVVLVGGGYVCVPIAVAAWMTRTPMVTLCVDIVPGWAVRLSSRLSTRVVTAFSQSLARLPISRTTVTGYPVRDEFLQADRDGARRRLGLPLEGSVVVVFGGSLGSQVINVALAGALDRLLSLAHVIHITGGGQADAAGAAVTEGSLAPAERHTPRYLRFAYMDAHGMADALVAADLAICRAGAATLAELPVTATPAVLIPGDFSAQEGNARSMAAQGAAVMIPGRELTADRLATETLALLRDRERLATMASCCRALARPDAADRIAELVTEVARGG